MSKCECCKEENSNLITYKGYKMCATCYMSYVSNVKVCENNAKYETEIDQLKQQLTEKDKEIEKLKRYADYRFEVPYGNVTILGKSSEDIQWLTNSWLRQGGKQLAIQELEKVNEILTDTIIEVTHNEFDLNKLCYLEEISARFYEKMQEQIKELKGE